MGFVLPYIFGIAVGLLISVIWFKSSKPKVIGNLRVDHSDPDSPYMFLELIESLDFLSDQKEVILKVRLEDYISRE